MKNSIIFFLLIIISIIFLTCSEDSGNARIQVVSELKHYTNIKLQSEKANNDNMQKTYVEALEVSKVMILINRLKFYRTNEDENAEGHQISTGPYVLIANDSNKINRLTNGEITPGVYDKIKFEFHRFSANELEVYKNDSLFGPFATSERYTIIIEGRLNDGLQWEEFTYKSNMTANITIKLIQIDYMNLVENADNIVSIFLLANILFNDDNKILDPRDKLNAGQIDNTIQKAIFAYKKQ